MRTLVFVGGLWDIFDKSGAIEIKDHEWELLDNDNPLKTLFMEKDDKRKI
jgi:hypothetical protein